MDRRAFIGTLGGGLLAAPLAAEAQEAGVRGVDGVGTWALEASTACPTSMAHYSGGFPGTNGTSTELRINTTTLASGVRSSIFLPGGQRRAGA
jgi:hypothetical protein